MKILLVHNFYGSGAPSGENIVFNAEKELLCSRGHEVATYTRYSDEIRRQGLWGAVRGAISTCWNPFSARSVRRYVSEWKPDVMHVHNTFPLISPAIFHSVNAGTARVLTLHNYRLFCPAAIPMRSGKVCTECLELQSVRPALQHGCYRGSRLATVPLALNVKLHRILGTWNSQVDAFIALTEFQRQILGQAGLALDKIHVKPNFYPANPMPVPWAEREDCVVFAGRLTAEKGVETLLQAWSAWQKCGDTPPELRILGDGPLRQRLEAIASGMPIRFLGQVPAAKAQEHIARARLLVLPSEWFEGFPMVLREAFAFGTPAAVSNIGSLPEIVNNGVSGILFEARNPGSLLQQVRTAWHTRGMLEKLSVGARASFESYYTEEASYQSLLNIYAAAIGSGKYDERYCHSQKP